MTTHSFESGAIVATGLVRVYCAVDTDAGVVTMAVSGGENPAIQVTHSFAVPEWSRQRELDDARKELRDIKEKIHDLVDDQCDRWGDE